MPAQRFIHPCLGHSDKVTMLTDFEFRVWTQYLLSADDFGVMRFSPITVQSDNDSLQERTLGRCRKALDKLRDVGLVQTFEHQGRAYAYQRDWVEYQAVEYPRATMHPKPTDDVIATMDPTTQTLFAKHPGGVGRPKKSPNGSRTVSEPLPNGTQTEKELARAQPRETQTLTLTLPQTPTQTPARFEVEDDIKHKAGRFLERYPEIYAEERRGAHFQLKPVLHFATACELVRGWPDLKRLELMFRTFCQLPSSEKMAWPGTPAQFLHLAPEIDVRLRQAGA